MKLNNKYLSSELQMKTIKQEKEPVQDMLDDTGLMERPLKERLEPKDMFSKNSKAAEEDKSLKNMMDFLKQQGKSQSSCGSGCGTGCGTSCGTGCGTSCGSRFYKK